MKASSAVIVLLLLFSAVAFNAIHAAPASLGTAFNYQGVLNSVGARASGNYDFQFALFDASTNGNQIGPTITNLNVPINSGIFSTLVDFGPGNFVGNAEWLAIGIRSNGSTGIFISLYPLQPLTATPNALFARNNAQDTNALVSQALLNSTITSLTNSLGGMANQPTNRPQFYSGINYGAFTTFTSGLDSNDEIFNWGGDAQSWYNQFHSVEPEWQFSTRGSVSWTIGMDGRGMSIGHFGGSGTYHSLWYMQYDDALATNLPGHSTPFGYVLHLNQGATQTGVFGMWMAEQVGTNLDYRLNWHHFAGAPPGFHQAEFMPSDYIAGGLGSNTLFWAGAELTNTMTRGNATIAPAATNAIDFSYTGRDFLVFNPTNALTLYATNLSYNNLSVVKDVIIHAGGAPISLTLPTNWIALYRGIASSNVLPTSIPAHNDLAMHIMANCGTTTNIYVEFSYSWNP